MEQIRHYNSLFRQNNFCRTKSEKFARFHLTTEREILITIIFTFDEVSSVGGKCIKWIRRSQPFISWFHALSGLGCINSLWGQIMLFTFLVKIKSKSISCLTIQRFFVWSVLSYWACNSLYWDCFPIEVGTMLRGCLKVQKLDRFSSHVVKKQTSKGASARYRLLTGL